VFGLIILRVEGDELFYLKGNPAIIETTSPLKSLTSYYFRIQGLSKEASTNRYRSEVLPNRNFYDETIRGSTFGFFGYGKKQRITKRKKGLKKIKRSKRVKNN